MDIEQKQLFNSDTIKHFISIIKNLEQKLSAINSIHENFYELISTISSTHQYIIQEIDNIKTILNQISNQQKNEIIEKKPQIDELKQTTELIRKIDIKSENNLASIDSVLISRNKRLSVSSQSSNRSSSTNSFTIDNRPSSSTNKYSSNLKKSSPTPTRSKSPKSVTFYFEQNNQDEQQIINDDKKEEQEEEEISDEINASPLILDTNENERKDAHLLTDLFKQHHQQVNNKPNIGYKLGNTLTIVRIDEIESINGDYIRLLNTSMENDYDLSGHYIQQNISCVPVNRFRFPSNTVIKGGQNVTIWSRRSTNIESQPPNIFICKEQKRWETGPECVTVLSKPNGQAIAWARSSNKINDNQASNEIFFERSKSNMDTYQSSPMTPNSINRSRLSSFDFIGNNNNKFRFGHSSPSSSLVNEDYNRPFLNLPNNIRTQISQTGGLSRLLTRPKSSPYSSHQGCKQDLIINNVLRKQDKQSTVKT